MSKFDMLSDSDIRIEKAETESNVSDLITSAINSDIRIEDTLINNGTSLSISPSLLNPNIRNGVFYSFYVSMPSQVDMSFAREHYTLGIDGQSIFNGSMIVNGPMTVNNPLRVNGDSIANGNLDVNGDLNLEGDIIIMGTRLTQNQLARLISLIS